jgi:hypothetical protein
MRTTHFRNNPIRQAQNRKIGKLNNLKLWEQYIRRELDFIFCPISRTHVNIFFLIYSSVALTNSSFHWPFTCGNFGAIIFEVKFAKITCGCFPTSTRKFTSKSEIFRHKTSHTVLSIIFLEDKHNNLIAFINILWVSTDFSTLYLFLDWNIVEHWFKQEKR